MSGQPLQRDEDLQVSQAEVRFLRRFFRRQALPWLAVTAALTLAAARWALPSGAPHAAPDRDALRSELAGALESVEELRSADRAFRGELDQLRRAAEPSVSDAELVRQLEELAVRLEALEGQPAGSTGSAPPAEAASWDVGAMLERLYNLEMRQERLDQGSAVRADLARRVEALERRLEAVPASPAP